MKSITFLALKASKDKTTTTKKQKQKFRPLLWEHLNNGLGSCILLVSYPRFALAYHDTVSQYVHPELHPASQYTGECQWFNHGYVTWSSLLLAGVMKQYHIMLYIPSMRRDWHSKSSLQCMWDGFASLWSWKKKKPNLGPSKL